MSQDRRLGILGLVVLLVFGVAWGRAAWLTTVDASSLQSKLADNRQPVTIPAPRGTITDKKGLVLAISEVAADVSASPRMIKDAPGVAAKLAPLIAATQADEVMVTTMIYSHAARKRSYELLRSLFA